MRRKQHDQTASPERRAAIQHQRLCEVVSYARKNSPCYAKLYADVLDATFFNKNHAELFALVGRKIASFMLP